MAEELKLVRTYDGTADIDTLNLLDYTDGFDVAYDGWVPKTAYGDETEVIETLTLRVDGTSHDDLAGKLQRLAQFSEYARWYRENANERYGVWLRAKLDGETGYRQSFVKQIDHAPVSSIYNRAVNELHHMNRYIVQMKRVPYWEGTALTTYVSEGDFEALSQTTRYWNGISVDSSNQNVYATVLDGDIYKQTAGTGNFTALSQTSRYWTSISVDSSNQNVYATAYDGDIYKQTAGTGNFTALSQTSRAWTSISVDSSNQNVYATVDDGDIYKQTAGTGNFTALSQTRRYWTSISVDSSNQNVYACVQDGDIYKQTAGTGNFTALSQTNRKWYGISVDSSNQNVYACVQDGDIYKQTAGAGDFEPLEQTSRGWRNISVDSSNQNVYATVPNGDIYESTIGQTIVGGTFSTNVVGDLPARISYLKVDGADTFGVGRYWLGFRSSRFGTPASFQPWYAFADEPGFDGTVSGTGLSYESIIGYTNFSSGTPQYFEITPSKHGIDINQQNGSYLVLARVFTQATQDEAYFRMRMYVTVGTAASATSTRYYPWVPVFGGDYTVGWGYRFYEMGVINIPVFGRIIDGAVPDMTNMKIGIEVYRTGGSDSFSADGIALIPIAEGLVKSSLPEIPGTVPTDMAVQQAIYTQSPDGDVSAYETDGTYITRVHDVSSSGGIPPGDGLIVFAADNMFGGSPDYKASLTLKVQPRWKELRGAE